MGLLKAQNAAIGMGPRHELLKRTVDTLFDLSTSFHRNEEILRGLRQYDRHRPIPEPDPIEGPPDGVLAPRVVLHQEGIFKEGYTLVRKALDKHCAYMDEWMHKIMFRIAARDEDAVLKKLHKLAVGWRKNTRKTAGEDCERQVLEAPIDQSCWSDPTTDDVCSILFGAFFRLSLASPRSPGHELFSRLSGCEQLNIPDPAFVARKASKTLEHMLAEAEAHSNELRLVVTSDIEGMGNRLSPASQRRWLDALRKKDIKTLQVLQTILPDDNLPWPSKVHKRFFSLLSLHWAGLNLKGLKCATETLVTILDTLKSYHYLPATIETPRPISKLYGRAMQYSHVVRHHILFKTFHLRAVQQFRNIVEQSCSNHRARKLMLAAMPASGLDTDLEQVRNIAMAAQLQQKSILDAAKALRVDEAQIARLS